LTFSYLQNSITYIVGITILKVNPAIFKPPNLELLLRPFPEPENFQSGGK
jgi:hypothetical protein